MRDPVGKLIGEVGQGLILGGILPVIDVDLPRHAHDTVLEERLTGALFDRLTHHVHILELNGESFRLRQSRKTKG